MQDRIIVRGGWEHNLKGVDVDLPRESLIVCTGVSGSGKSSLAFDTIYQEGQRRFLESLSAYARQFLGQMEKPRVDHIEGLSPTICIDQKTINRNPRSTVGTITEIYDHLRLLFARLGTPHCPECGEVIAHQTPGQIADILYMDNAEKRGMILAPIVQARKGEYRKELRELYRDGYLRARIDGEIRELAEDIELDRYVRHTIEVVLDRVVFDRESRGRIVEALEKAIEKTGGLVSVLIGDEHKLFAANRACPNGHMSIPELEPRFFSFNTPQGACPRCDGLGEVTRFHPKLIVPDERLSISGGAIQCLTKEGRVPFSYLGIPEIAEILPKAERDLHRPWRDLPEALKERILEGDAKKSGEKKEGTRRYVGVIPAMERSYRYTRATFMERFLKRDRCPGCDGQRLHPISLAVTFREHTIWQLSTQTISDSRVFFEGLEVEGAEALIGNEIFKEILSRLGFLEEVGLGYLSLHRSAATLSGGEGQRIRLASQVGSGLQGVLYVLDEPSIGLHPRDNRSLIETLLRLRDQGNTVLVVEHDQETMEAADYILDIGPGAGKLGGHVVAAGPPDVVRQSDSITGRFLRGEEEIPLPKERRPIDGDCLILRDVWANNLKNIDVSFPLGTLTVVTGVSGSGKSTLVVDILHKVLAQQLHGAKVRAEAFGRIEGLEHIDKVIEIDQAPIGRTPRSNPATYTGVMDPIRNLFADTGLSRRRGYTRSRFSFNVDGGRCQHCKGSGIKNIEMQFMANVDVPCEYCGGGRFKPSTLEVKYRGKSIGDVLAMTVSEAAEFFARIPKISRILKTMCGVGLGYVSLGQPSTTLSGGEAQRVKLASELHRPSTGRTFYILDEPTTGLHMSDVRQLLAALQKLVDGGNTVLVIEHNMDLVKVADHVIDLGPEGGAGGGYIVAQGTPEQIARVKESYTGQVLAPIFGFEPPPPPMAKPRMSPKRAGLHKRFLTVTGAQVHNLRHVDVEIPHDKLTVVTGVSGSGKTSLAFDTIFAEGQRRYVESMSTYARRFLGRLDKAPIESIEGIAPAISVDQKTAPRNPRSTVATTTEIYDYLRLLYARVGIAHSPISGNVLTQFSPETAMKAVLDTFEGQRGEVVTPLPPEPDERGGLKNAGGELAIRQIGVGGLLSQGYTKVRVDGTLHRLDRPGAPLLLKGKEIDLVIDRVSVKAGEEERIAEAFEKAFEVGDGIAYFVGTGAERRGFSTALGCMDSEYFLRQEVTPRLFSFNSHVGACVRCDGLGRAAIFDLNALLTSDKKPLLKMLAEPVKQFLARNGDKMTRVMKSMAEKENIPLAGHWSTLDDAQKKKLLWGVDGIFVYTPLRSRSKLKEPWPGLIPLLDTYLVEFTDKNDRLAKKLRTLMVDSLCPICEGDRLKALPRNILIEGINITELCRKTVGEVGVFLKGVVWDSRIQIITVPILREVLSRLHFLQDVGLEYLTLERRSATLSGGESQRIRLASQLGSHLVGVLYVLDEPTVGLHPRDTERLLKTLEDLRNRGNTLVIVEHDKDTMMRADYLIDMGPGAGERGGRVVSAGTPAEVIADENSMTGAFLSGKKSIPVPEERQEGTAGVHIFGAAANNLKGLDVAFKRGQLTCVTGVSGSGKSTLVMDILAKVLARDLNGASHVPGEHTRTTINDSIQKMTVIDQSPLGRSPKSNPATYVGAMNPIRDLFAALPESRVRGYTKSRFSFNVAGGRCSACDGRGAIKVEMHFLSDVWVTCESCKGRRFNDATLEVKFKGKHVADILKMEVDEALDFFANQKKIARVLKPLSEVGLGYLSLGQAATTLSGGEAQRVKLSTALLASRTPCMYILDEPTTGLHFSDIKKLVMVLTRLVSEGHGVVVIEHNPDMMKVADCIIDLGPEGGNGGGEIVAWGTPEEVADNEDGNTGPFLKVFLAEERARRVGLSG